MLNSDYWSSRDIWETNQNMPDQKTKVQIMEEQSIAQETDTAVTAIEQDLSLIPNLKLSRQELAETFFILRCDIIKSTIYQKRVSDTAFTFTPGVYLAIYHVDINRELNVRQAVLAKALYMNDRALTLVNDDGQVYNYDNIRHIRGFRFTEGFDKGHFEIIPLITNGSPDYHQRLTAPRCILKKSQTITEDEQNEGFAYVTLFDGMSNPNGARETTAEEKRQYEVRRALKVRKGEIRVRIRTMRRERERKEQEIIKKQRERELINKSPMFVGALRNSLELIYPNLHDLILSPDAGVITMKIHFPEVNITNSQGANHKIFDLFVSLKFSISTGKVVDSTLIGERTSFNYSEYISTYSHSHLPGEAIRGEAQFCLNGNNLQTLLTDIRMRSFFDAPENWIRTFEGILFQLESYVSWESLEGSCYRKIKEISVVGVNQIDFLAETIHMVSKLDPNDTPPLIYKKGVGFQLSSETEAFEDWLVKYASHTQYRNERGEYYVDSTEGIPKENFIVPNSKPVKFKGKDFLRIVRVDFYHENKEKRKKYCHGQIKGAFVKWANQKLKRAFSERNLRVIFRDILASNKKTSDAYSIIGQSKTKAELSSFLKTFTPVSDV